MLLINGDFCHKLDPAPSAVPSGDPHLAGLFTGASWTVGGLSGSCMGSVPATRPWRQGVCFVIS